MTRSTIFHAAALAATGALVLAIAGPAIAQAASPITAAIASGDVGEQADGYLGIAGSVSGEVRAEVNAINIKRRAAYTDLAAKRGVTVSDVAAATGCQTLATRVRPGQAYRIGTDAWKTRGTEPIALPPYCASTGG